MKEEEFCNFVQEIREEFGRCLKPVMNAIMKKEKKDLISTDFIILAEAIHKLWIISEILKGRTAFLRDDDSGDVIEEESTAMTTKEMIDFYGRKILEAKNKLLINKN